MSTADDLRSRVAAGLAEQPDAYQLLPTLLTQACVAVLPIAGASLSLITDRPTKPNLRVPLGFSDPVSARIERLQTTLGEGPCLQAAALGLPMAADETTMARQWPTFHHDLIRQTPIRYIASLPITPPPQTGIKAALNLYLTPAQLIPADNTTDDTTDDTTETADGTADEDASTAEAPAPAHAGRPQFSEWHPTQVISELLQLHPRQDSIPNAVTALLFAPADRCSRTPGWPASLNTASAARRLDVWIAIGMLTEAADLTSSDALAVLRGYAYTQQRSLDWVANQLINRHITSGDIMNTN